MSSSAVDWDERDERPMPSHQKSAAVTNDSQPQIIRGWNRKRFIVHSLARWKKRTMRRQGMRVSRNQIRKGTASSAMRTLHVIRATHHGESKAQAGTGKRPK